MGTMTISINDETEQKLRKYAELKYGNKKGRLANVITEAIEDKINESEKKKAITEALEIMEKDFKVVKVKHRSELYDRC